MTVFLTLGELTFANFEIPSKINFGGDQVLSTKKYVGGQRVIDSLGRDDRIITWSGRFSGATAQQRAKFLDGMRVSGNQYNLYYSQFNYLVKIKSFDCDFELINNIPYKISCEVVQDLNQPFTVLLPVSYNDAIDLLLEQAIDLADLIANPSVSSSIALFSIALNQVGDLDNASSSALATLTEPLNSAISTTADATASVTSSIF